MKMIVAFKNVQNRLKISVGKVFQLQLNKTVKLIMTNLSNFLCLYFSIERIESNNRIIIAFNRARSYLSNGLL